MTTLDSLLKSRDIILPKKVHLAKTMVFLVVWTIELDYKESQNYGFSGSLDYRVGL